MKKETVYTDGAATLYHADFLDAARSIQDNSIDFVFTDPPFELTGGGMKHSKLSYQGGEIFCKNGFSTKGIEFQKWVPEIYRVLKHGRYFYVMSNDRNLFSLHAACMENHFQFCELLVMDKKMTVPSTYYPKRAEFILMYRKGNFRKTRFCGSTIIETKIPRGKEKRHPTEKPVSMIEHFINCSTLENEICLDPFMGSCPVGEACLLTGRKFIGVEIEKKWFQTSQERIAAIHRKIPTTPQTGGDRP